jgi:hypothetical protein
MNNTAASGPAAISRRFVIFWMLSLVVPGLILMLLRGLLLGNSTSVIAYWIAAAAPAPVWLLIGFLQYRLLRPYLHSSLWWLLATFAGGILGMFVGGPVLELMKPESEIVVLANETTPAWMFAPYPLFPAAVAGAVGAAILGLSQAFSLERGARGGLLWICVSAFSGALGAVVGGVAHLAYAHSISTLNPATVENNLALQVIIALSIAMVAGMLVYGLLTGLVMRWLIVHGERQTPS